MSRIFCVPGIFFIFSALVLNLLVSISLPLLPPLDIARTRFGNAIIKDSQNFTGGVTEIRFGIWAPCFYDSQEDRTCFKPRLAYDFTITNESGETVEVESAWTRGLVLHPLATAVTFIALLPALSSHVVVTLIASILSFLAAAVTVIAFAIDIALFVLVRRELNKLGSGISTKAGPGFWITFGSIILLLLAGCTVCFGRRRDRSVKA